MTTLRSWWPIKHVDGQFVTSKGRRKESSDEKSHQHNDSVTIIKSPTLRCHQHDYSLTNKQYESYCMTHTVNNSLCFKNFLFAFFFDFLVRLRKLNSHFYQITIMVHNEWFKSSLWLQLGHWLIYLKPLSDDNRFMSWYVEFWRQI